MLASLAGFVLTVAAKIKHDPWLAPGRAAGRSDNPEGHGQFF
ncbi:MAG TPA: hypothetical protein VGP69_07845 [Gaiellaceae bacterium]|nr:hypothetical protein [Gaiellaceae bacterium]